MAPGGDQSKIVDINIISGEYRGRVEKTGQQEQKLGDASVAAYLDDEYTNINCQMIQGSATASERKQVKELLKVMEQQQPSELSMADQGKFVMLPHSQMAMAASPGSPMDVVGMPLPMASSRQGSVSEIILEEASR